MPNDQKALEISRGLKGETYDFMVGYRSIRHCPLPTRHRRRDLLSAAKMPQVWHPVIEVANGDRKATQRVFLKSSPSIIVKPMLQLALEQSKRRSYLDTSCKFCKPLKFRACERITSRCISESKSNLQNRGELSERGLPSR